MVACAVAVVVLLAGCGASSETRSTSSRELSFLQVGVDPATEAEAAAASLSRAGFRVRTRVDGQGFTAMSFSHREGGATAVRIATRRGIAVALDAAGTDAPVDLIAPARAGAHDADGDRADEIVLRTTDAVVARECLAVLRVDDAGAVSPIPATDDLGTEVCIESVADVNADGRADAIAVVRFPTLARDATPAVAVPLVVRAGVWAPAGRSATGHFDDERRRRADALAAAARALDLETAYRLAVELAAIARFAGAPSGDQVRAFDDALRGLVLTPALARAVADARAAIAAGWR